MSEQDIKEIKETLKNATVLLSHISEDMVEVKGDVKSIKEVQESHSQALDELLKNTKTWQAEIAAVKSAIKRHEDMIAKIAVHLGLDLEKS